MLSCFMPPVPLTSFRPDRRIVRRSQWCTYCGYAFETGESREDEHVIGRRFVPKGTIAGQWNLILTACGKCNDMKAELENDISAITMQPDSLGRYATDDPRLITEAKRKARTTSQRTGRFVSEPERPITISMPLGGATISFSFSSPAQVDENRLFQLARFQLAGFFSMLTWDAEQQRGYYWPGSYMPVVAARKEDWGNPLLGWVTETAKRWDYRLHAIAADTFYKIWIKRRPDDPAVWAWIMEWNHNFRLGGFFGNEEALLKLRMQAPKLKPDVIHEGPDARIGARIEIPLPEAVDHVFAYPTDRMDSSRT